ncbi:MAG: hypothetical protein QM773_04090 [Hyphomonadaceae bacterium]
MQWGDIEGYLGRTFLDSTGQLPSPDVVLGIVFTIISFAIGWMASFRGSRKRVRAQVIDELILSQSELKARAYPKVWRQGDTREAWMLDPFVARLRFLYSSVNEAKSLTRRQLDFIEAYMMRVQEFIEKWENTESRRDAYHYMYEQTYIALRTATKELGLKEMRRLGGLARPQESLFSAPQTPPRSNPPFAAVAPAE